MWLPFKLTLAVGLLFPNTRPRVAAADLIAASAAGHGDGMLARLPLVKLLCSACEAHIIL